MNPACSLCKGACCESIILPLKMGDLDADRWLRYHAEELDRGWMFDVKCSKLKNGKCSIYDTRPNLCAVFVVGSQGCLDAVRRRRPFKEKEIRRLIEDSNSDTSSENG